MRDALVQITKQFFDLHWPSHIAADMPNWSAPFKSNCTGSGFLNNNRQGCYALYEGDKLVYVGVGAGKGSGPYKGHGLGHRLKHVLSVDWSQKGQNGERYYKTRDKWHSITHVRTIGFPEGMGYLALSLEAFLLYKLDPTPMRNTVRPGTT